MIRFSEAAVNYREPLGLNHIDTKAQYRPAPWSARSKSFHDADEKDIGFGRTVLGPDAMDQYQAPLNGVFNNMERTPEKYFLWFHHVL